LGTFGVDLFFVISGFVISLSANRLTGPSAAGNFLWHRFRRINPVYYAATLLMLLTWIPGFIRHTQPPIIGSQLTSSVTLLRYPGWVPPLLFQAWTLSYEWYFYLVVFALILLRIRRKERGIIVLFGGMIALGWLLQGKEIGILGFYTDPYLFEFILGVIIGYWATRRSPDKRIAWGLLIPGIILSVFWLTSGRADLSQGPSLQTPFYLNLHAFGWGLAAALIVAGCVFLEKSGTPFFHRHPFILLLGDASYSIYLFHMIVLGAIDAIYLKWGLFLPPDLAILLQAIAMVAGSLLFYKWAEQPLLKILRKNPSSPPIPSPPAAP
jgi:peptidoglycan/LPS O-acetylase OafA/YrhL